MYGSIYSAARSAVSSVKTSFSSNFTSNFTGFSAGVVCGRVLSVSVPEESVDISGESAPPLQEQSDSAIITDSIYMTNFFTVPASFRLCALFYIVLCPGVCTFRFADI